MYTQRHRHTDTHIHKLLVSHAFSASSQIFDLTYLMDSVADRASEDILAWTPWSVYLETLRNPRVLSSQEPPKQEAVMGPRAAFTSNVVLASFQLHNTEHMLGLKFHQLSKQTTRSSCGPRVATRWEVSPYCNVRDVYAQVLGSRLSVSSQETKWKDHWHPKPSHWRTPIIATSECLKGQ